MLDFDDAVRNQTVSFGDLAIHQTPYVSFKMLHEITYIKANNGSHQKL